MIRYILLFLSPIFLYSGSAEAKITCQSPTGRTVFVLYDTDGVGQFSGAKLSIDKKKINYSLEGEVTIVSDLKRGVYTFKYYYRGVYLTFYAIPKSVKDRSKNRVSKYMFDGLITSNSTDPRTHKRLDKTIMMQCSSIYDWGNI